jgi:hypothetical protein
MDRLGDILHNVLTEIIETEGKYFPDKVVGGPGQAYAGGFRERLETGCNVHCVAKEVDASDDNIANMDTNPKLNPVPVRNILIRFGQLFLHGRSALDCVDDAPELSQYAVAGRIGNPSAVLTDKPVHDLAMGG